MRVNSTVRSNFHGSSAKPGAMACISQGISRSAATVNRISAVSSTDAASPAKRRAASRPSRSSRVAKSGTKAALNAPSAKRRRQQLGNLKATKKEVRKSVGKGKSVSERVDPGGGRVKKQKKKKI